MDLESSIKWPKGPMPARFYKSVYVSREAITGGTLLSIDPSTGATGLPGFALFKQGKLRKSGVIELKGNERIQYRLGDLMRALMDQFECPDVMIIEMLRGKMTPAQLHWAAGVSIGAVRSPILIECPIVIWKAVAKTVPSYQKSDEQDAILMGQAVIQRALEHY